MTLEHHPENTAQIDSTQTRQQRLVWCSAVLGFIILTIAVWYPFGFQTTGLIEEWSIYAGFDQGQPFYALDLIKSQPNRLTSSLPLFIGYELDQNSFVGINIVFVFLFIAECLLLYAVLRLLLHNAPLAFFSAVLFVVFPADTGQTSFRALAYHSMIVAYLFAAYSLLVYLRTSRRTALVGICLGLLICLTTYEVAFPLVLATPFILWKQYPATKERFKRAYIAWFGSVGALLILNGILLFGRARYLTESMNAERTHNLAEQLASYLYYLAHAYYRTFFEGWMAILNHASLNPVFLLIAVTVGLLMTTIALTQFSVSNRQARRINLTAHMRTLIGSLCFIGLGFLPFLLSPNHRSITERTLLMASLGGATGVVVLVYLISQVLPYHKMAFVSLMGLLIIIAVLGSLEQRQDFLNYSNIERKILRDIIEQLPKPADRAAILLFDADYQFPLTEQIFALHDTSLHFGDAIRYIYRSYALEVHLCYPELGLRGNSKVGCELRLSEVAIFEKDKETTTIGYDRVIAFAYHKDGSVSLLEQLPLPTAQSYNVQNYQPHNLIDAKAPLPVRFYTLLQNGSR